MIPFVPIGPGGTGVLVDLPTTADPQAVPIGDDLVSVVASAIAASSEVRVSIRRCENTRLPDVELTRSAGLVSVAGQSSFSATDGSVSWAADAITVRVAASAVAHLRPGRYLMAIEEETAVGWRLLEHGRELLLYRTGGGLRV